MKRLAAFCVLASMFAILTLFAIPQVAQAAQTVLILTDNSPAGGVNGASHVSDLIAAFASVPGAIVTTNSTELTNGSAMPLSLVTGKNVVIIVTVSGTQIDAGDVPVLQTAVNTHASDAFMFFTDACVECTGTSAAAALSIVNAVTGWSATLGNADDSGYVASLTGAYYPPFTGVSAATGAAYSRLINVPTANVIYTCSLGPSAVVAPGTANYSCVFMATDVTPFWVTGGISSTQATGLAAAYLNAAAACPLQPSPSYVLTVTTVGCGSVTKTPDVPLYPSGTVVQLTATGGFVGWSGDASGSANPLSVAMGSNKNITATFAASGTCHELLFQDTFSSDGTLTGTARADMAKDIRPSGDPIVVPGDSAVVEVPGPLAVDPSRGRAAVYLYVAIWPLGQAGKVGAPLSQGPGGPANRFPYIATQSIAGVPWTRLLMDSVYVDNAPVPGRYCVDLNDNLFTPGDTICYFWSAKDNVGVTTYHSRAYGGNGHDFTTQTIDDAAGSPMEFTILPAGGWRRGGDILYVDGADDYAEDAQVYFDTAFQQLGLAGKVDRYDVLAPASASGNRLGSRVVNGPSQLNGCYRKIIWDTGNYLVTLGDGSGTPEKTDDYDLLVQFLNALASPGGVYLCGDNVAQSLDAYGGAGAITFRSTYMPFTLVTGDHHGPPTNLSLSPKIVHWPGRCFVDDFMASGAPQIHNFDVMGTAGTSQVEMSYSTALNVNGAVLSNVNGNARVIMSGFSFAFIRDDESNGISDRAQHLHDIITWLGNVIGPPTAAGPVLTNSLSEIYPNPFNPQTTIAFSIKDRGLVSLKVYNVAGQLVRTLVNESLAAGPYKNVWDGRNDAGQTVSSGVYFCKLVANTFSQTKKMVLLK